MKTGTHNIICTICAIIFIILLIGAAVVTTIADDNGYDNVCKIIGDKLNVTFLFQSHGECGWGIKCYYQCRFVDSNGDIVIKSVG